MNSRELVGVVDAGGEPGVELFLGGHLCHLILHRSDIDAVSILAVVTVAHFEEPCVQFFLSLGGNLSPFLVTDTPCHPWYQTHHVTHDIRHTRWCGSRRI